MKHSNLFLAGLMLLVLFLIYQIIDLKQEIKTISSTSQPQVVVPNGFTIYGQTNGSSNQDGYWLYKDDEKVLYFFNYDPETKEIRKLQRRIND